MTSGQQRTSILSAPGAPALLGSSIVARLPLAMFSIALLVHAQRLTGSFAVAGAVGGAYAIASALSAPLLGRVVDHWGQTRVLVSGATLTAATVVTEGLLPTSAPPLLLIALGAATGLCTPPLAACMRALLPVIAADPSRLSALFALESTVLELTFVLGPPLALGLGALWSTGAALVLSGVVMLGGALTFAAQPASRRWRPETTTRRPRGGSLNSATMRTLVVILFGTGVVFGATEVGVTAAAHALGSTAAAGPVLGLWGVGSLLGGIAATRRGGAKGAIFLLAMLALTHAALILTTGSMLAIAAVIVLAGATIAPTVSSIYAMVDEAAPAGTRTEAFSWALTASLSGAAFGAAGAGSLAQSAGARAAFALAGAAGAATVLAAILRSPRLEHSKQDTGPAPLDPRAPRHAGQSNPPARHTSRHAHRCERRRPRWQRPWAASSPMSARPSRPQSRSPTAIQRAILVGIHQRRLPRSSSADTNLTRPPDLRAMRPRPRPMRSDTEQQQSTLGKDLP